MYELIGLLGWLSAIIAVVVGILILWCSRDDALGEPDGVVSTGPICYGKYDPTEAWARECSTCIYRNQCLKESE